ncbi:centrosome-associated protein CEP250 isoform X2 [Engraulis encrasicolus]|uniref:centrosome-associated protein CEP250 isoform X2 n=1 Tax=Engraulis encrasicolus TaxID=184585 RepID=UPI002FD00C56
MHVEVRLLQESTEQLQRRCDEAQLLLEEHEHRHRSTVEALKEEELKELDRHLVADGLCADADQLERLLHLWRLHLRTQGLLNTSRLEARALQEAHGREVLQVKEKLGYLQALTVKQNSISSKVQEQNRQLHTKLDQLLQEKEAQKEEVCELLCQGGLEEMGGLSPSEQVAYLLAERASLLERLQAVEEEATVEKSPITSTTTTPAGSTLRVDTEHVDVVKDGVDKPPSDEAACGGGGHSDGERVRLERDLEEASCRLAMAHKEIRRLTDELESAHMTQRAHEKELQCVEQRFELLKQEMDKLRLSGPDLDEFHKTRELCEHLAKENQLLKVHIGRMEMEREELVALAKKIKEDLMEGDGDEAEDDAKVEKVEIGLQTDTDDTEKAHVRCQEQLRERDVEVRLLQESTEQLQRRCDEAQLLLEEHEHRHRSTVEALKEELDFLNTVVKQQAEARQQENQTKAQESLLQDRADEGADMSALMDQYRDHLQAAERALMAEREQTAKLQQQHQQQTQELERLQKLFSQEKSQRKQEAEVKRQENQATMDEYLAIIKAQESLLQERADEGADMSALMDQYRDHLQAAERALMAEREQTAKLQQQHQQQTQELEILQDQTRQLQVEASQRERQMAELQQQYQAQSEAFEILQGQSRQLQAVAELHESQMAKQQQLQQAQTEEIEILQEQTRQLQSLLSQQESHNKLDVAKLQDQLVLDKEKLCGKEKEMQTLQQQLKEAACEVDRLRREAQATAHTLAKQQADGEQHLQHRQQWQQSVEVLEGELRGVREQEASLREAALHHHKHIQQLLDQHTHQQKEAHEREAQLKAELQSKSQDLSAAGEQVESLQREVRSVEAELRQERAESQGLRAHAQDTAQHLATLTSQAEEDTRHRKLWLCREDALLQQVGSLQEELASLQRSEHQLQQRALSLEAQLAAQQEAHQDLVQELHASSLQANSRLLDSQNEVQARKDEQKQTLMDVDKQLSNYEEKLSRLHHKLSSAKQSHLKEVRQQDEKVRELQRQCEYLTSKVEKVTDLVHSMEKVNNELLSDKRQCQAELFKEQEARRETDTKLQTCTCRIKCLEEIINKWENGTQDKILLNLIKETRVPSPYHISNTSPPAGIQSALAILGLCDQSVQKAHSAKHHGSVSSPLVLTRTGASEMGYLNLTPPVNPLDSQTPANDGSTAGSNSTVQTEVKKSCLTERFL